MQTFSYNVPTIYSGNGRGGINLGLQLKDEANPTGINFEALNLVNTYALMGLGSLYTKSVYKHK